MILNNSQRNDYDNNKMLKSTQRALRFSYNNYNNWRRFSLNSSIQAEQKVWKKDFKEGDEAEFAYDNKVMWP